MTGVILLLVVRPTFIRLFADQTRAMVSMILIERSVNVVNDITAPVQKQ